MRTVTGAALFNWKTSVPRARKAKGARRTRLRTARITGSGALDVVSLLTPGAVAFDGGSLCGCGCGAEAGCAGAGCSAGGGGGGGGTGAPSASSFPQYRSGPGTGCDVSSAASTGRNGIDASIGCLVVV